MRYTDEKTTEDTREKPLTSILKINQLPALPVSIDVRYIRLLWPIIKKAEQYGWENNRGNEDLQDRQILEDDLSIGCTFTPGGDV